MIVTAVEVILIIGVLAYWRWRSLNHWKRLGISGPEPNFLFGNTLELSKNGFVNTFPKWTEKYGPIVGFYIGGHPQLLVTDLELIRQITTTDFNNFSTRNEVINGGVHPQPMLRYFLIWQTGSRWRNMRVSMSPTFTSSKIRSLEPEMIKVVEEQLQTLQKYTLKGEINIASVIKEMSTVNSSRNILSVSSVGRDSNSKFAKAMHTSSSPKFENSIIAMLMIIFPVLNILLWPLRFTWEWIRFNLRWSGEGFGFFDILKIVELRRCRANNNDNKVDLIDILLTTRRLSKNTKISDHQLVATSGYEEKYDTVNKTSNETFNTEEIASNAFLFFLASFETTSSALQFVFCNLINHQDIQNRLREDLKRLKTEGNGEFNIRQLEKIPLLMNVIKESLRLHPVAAPFVNRVALSEYRYQHFIIPKGTGIYIGSSSIHMNPNFWSEPETFDPDRFNLEYNKSAYLPFGQGPRNCIGMRFAYSFMAIVVAQSVSQFQFLPGPSTEREIIIHETFSTLAPKNGVPCYIRSVNN